jgi:hypothetical protein
MSATTSSATSSSTANAAAEAYATQLAQTSALKRSLSNLGSAIQSGNLTSAGTILTSIIQANPQFSTSSSGSSGSSGSQDPVNQDFETLATAIQNNDLAGAQSAWSSIKTDLANQGITNLNSSSTDTSQLLAQNKESVDQEVLSAMFGISPGSTPSVAELLGGAGSSTSTDPVNSLITNWLTYQAGGNATPSSADPTGTNLNTVA